MRKSFQLILLLNSSILILIFSCSFSRQNELIGYSNQTGNYGFNYPKSWKAYETGTDVYFELKGGKVDVFVHPIKPYESYETIQAEFHPLYFDARFSNTIVDMEPALRNDHIGKDNEIVGRSYFIIHDNLLYQISLYSDPETQLPKNFTDILHQFDELILSFRFLD